MLPSGDCLPTAPGLFSRLLGTIICHAFALVKFYLPILSIAIAHKLACNDFACVSSEVCSDLPLRKPLEFGLSLSASAVDVGQELGTHWCATLNVGYVSALFHRLQLRAMAMFFVALAVAKFSALWRVHCDFAKPCITQSTRTGTDGLRGVFAHRWSNT